MTACTQVEMNDAPDLLRLSEADCPMVSIRPPRSRRPKSWDTIEDQVVPLERVIYGRPLAELWWVTAIRKYFCWRIEQKVPEWECWYLHRKNVLFLSLCVDVLNIGIAQEKLSNMWAKPKRKVGLEDPKPFINQVYLACAQREVQVNNES